MDARLSMVSALIPVCDFAADIGADHGFLGASLLASGRCARVLFTDISENSLCKAREYITKLKLADRAIFARGDGFDAFDMPVDAAVIAGMGGMVIAGIVERGIEKLTDTALILQPNTAAATLRERLSAMDFSIDDEELTRSGGRWYTALRAKRGFCTLSKREIIAGPALLGKRHPLLRDYARHKIRVLSKAHAGAKQGPEYKARPIREELAVWKQIENER
jgi:tRNA (adenine22-N1)-methyltransferase